ncbi:MAG: hypothetical protein CVV23_02795 [Ignavibacteriae bacterium HGW-Ignavibacteriae-2]|jgi:Lon protease-like protein|nr:LON peptidase substrate-binding domain-containing protein [Bacteroidota bacterium]PKL89977.1 MAG: hypothetical protein CVV23_02795 [Ignavibacteriae bacterium HGW-Ignavibacteriae-2]
MKKVVPIFPLNLVMFPDAIYPLHIFEERYKRMINKSIKNNSYFGIVSKIDLDISRIGCLVKVASILKKHENRSMDILVKGYSRFIAESTSFHDDGYLEAEVSLFGDTEYMFEDNLLFRETLEIFKSIIDRTSLQLGEGFWNKLENATDKSFKLAEKSGLNLKQQQDILSLQSEKERMKYLHKHLEKLENTLERAEILKELISTDGYIN